MSPTYTKPGAAHQGPNQPDKFGIHRHLNSVECSKHRVPKPGFSSLRRIRPGKADLIERIYPSAERVDIQAGHCAHDENPEAVNPEILKWVAGLDAKAAVAKL